MRRHHRGQGGGAEAGGKVQGPMFSDTIGKVKMSLVELLYKVGFQLVQPPSYPVAYHYQDRPLVHLRKLNKEGVS